MLLWVREELCREGNWAAWNTCYSENKSHFGRHELGFRFTLDLLLEQFSRRAVRVLEIGCGQGYIMESLYEQFSRNWSAPQKEESRFVGLDASEAAIIQSDDRVPECYWIADELQRFLTHPLAAYWQGEFDLIFSMGGFTYIKAEEECRKCAKGLKALLKPRGMFTYFISEGYYRDKWTPKFCKGWSVDQLEIFRQEFGREENRDLSAYIRRIYHNDVPMPADRPDL